MFVFKTYLNIDHIPVVGHMWAPTEQAEIWKPNHLLITYQIYEGKLTFSTFALNSINSVCALAEGLPCKIGQTRLIFEMHDVSVTLFYRPQCIKAWAWASGSGF